MKLPSERYPPGSPKPIGFIDEPDRDHIARSSQALEDLSLYVRELPQGGAHDILRVSYCHTLYTPGLPTELFAFHVWGVTHARALTEHFPPDDDVRYALIVNQPVPLQLEVALTFLFELLYRRRMTNAIDTGANPISKIDELTVAADEAARRELANRLQYGWRDAARSAVEEANRLGVRLVVSYQLDPLPEYRDIANRVPLLKRVYNEVRAAREFVDKTVSMITGPELTLRAKGGSEFMRSYVERQLSVLNVRQYFNHALRDGEVCGNGYVAFPDAEPLVPIPLEPEFVQIVGDNRYVYARPGEPPVEYRDLLHVTGTRQLSSPYGISILEPFLFVVRQLDVFQNVRELSEQALERPDLPSTARRTFEQHIALATRMGEDIDDRVQRMVWFPRDHLPPPFDNLYLPGHERYVIAR